MSERADVLEAMLTTQGWSLFQEHVKAEWGPAACWRKAKETQETDSARAIEKVDYTNAQVGLLMNWPHEEISRLRRVEERAAPSLSRRGGL